VVWIRLSRNAYEYCSLVKATMKLAGSIILWEFLDCERTVPVTFTRRTVPHEVRQLGSIN